MWYILLETKKVFDLWGMSYIMKQGQIEHREKEKVKSTGLTCLHAFVLFIGYISSNKGNIKRYNKRSYITLMISKVCFHFTPGNCILYE